MLQEPQVTARASEVIKGRVGVCRVCYVMTYCRSLGIPVTLAAIFVHRDQNLRGSEAS